MTKINTFPEIGAKIKNLTSRTNITTDELVEYLLRGNPIYHGFGLIRFARFLESGLIVPSGDDWHNPYSTSEIYFSPRLERAAGHYAFTGGKFSKEMGVLEQIAQGNGTKTPDKFGLNPESASRAIDVVKQYQRIAYSGDEVQRDIGFVVKLNLPSSALKLQFGNPIEAYNSYLVIFDEDCWRLDVEDNPVICRQDSGGDGYGLDVVFIEDIYVVKPDSSSSKAISLKTGKKVEFRQRRECSSNEINQIFPKLTYKQLKYSR